MPAAMKHSTKHLPDLFLFKCLLQESQPTLRVRARTHYMALLYMENCNHKIKDSSCEIGNISGTMCVCLCMYELEYILGA